MKVKLEHYEAQRDPTTFRKEVCMIRVRSRDNEFVVEENGPSLLIRRTDGGPLSALSGDTSDQMCVFWQ